MTDHAALCAIVLCLAITTTGSAENLPPGRIAAMYTGWIAPNQEDRDLQANVVEAMLDPLAEAHFTAFYAKFQGLQDRQFDLSDPEQLDRVRLVAEACEERGLALVAYTYHHPHHGRNPERHAQYEPLVMASGRVVEDRFALANYETWRFISDEVFQLARASREMPIACVGIDVEHLMGFPASYDDKAWADFAAERGFDAGLAAAQRGPFVTEQGLAEEYTAWYFDRWDAVIERWCEEIHAINPELSICIMPAHHTHRLTKPFCVHAGTERAPAVIDNWGMYNGSGLTQDLLQQQDEVKALNPHNRFILWLRPDSYRPSDIRVQAYHTLMKTDGYCNWHIGMMLAGGRDDVPQEWGYAAYWRAYGEANEAALADIAAGREEPSIPFEPVEPLVAKLDLSAFEGEAIPQLRPAGDGGGEDAWIPTRGLEQFLIHAEGGEQIGVEIRHLAGRARPLALQYALLAPDGRTLRDEAVSPGATEEFAVDAPETGTYALYVTGGAGGQAWYAVRVRNRHFAFPFRSQGGDSARLFYIKAWGPRTFWLTRSDPDEPATLTVSTGRSQAILVQIGDAQAEVVLDEPRSFDLPAGPEPIRLVIAAPDELPDGFYVQGVHLRVAGAVHPYLAISPERRLLP